MPFLISAPVRARWARHIALGARLLLALGFMSALKLPAAPVGSVARAIELKAVFVFNFTIFVQWPPAALPPPGEPFRIGVLGDAPIAEVLQRVVQGERAAGRSIVVQQSNRPSDLLDCQLVFAQGNAHARVDELLASCHERPILTVGETRDFTRRGGDIRLFLEHNQLRIEINPASLARRGLKPSAKLLRVARLLDE